MQGPEPKVQRGAFTDAEECEVPGLSLIKDFVTGAEEQVRHLLVSSASHLYSKAGIWASSACRGS